MLASNSLSHLRAQVVPTPGVVHFMLSRFRKNVTVMVSDPDMLPFPFNSVSLLTQTRSVSIFPGVWKGGKQERDVHFVSCYITQVQPLS